MIDARLKCVVYSMPVDHHQLCEALRYASDQYYTPDPRGISPREKELMELYMGSKLMSLYNITMPRLDTMSVKTCYPELSEVFNMIDITVGEDAYTMDNTHYPSVMHGMFDLRIIDDTHVAINELYSGNIL